MQEYLIYVEDGKIREGRAHAGNCRCMIHGSTREVLLSVNDREALSKAVLCQVAVKAARAHVSGESIALWLATCAITDRDFVEWVEAFGGTLEILSRSDEPYYLDARTGRLSRLAWVCTFGDTRSEALYPYDAVAGVQHVNTATAPARVYSAPREMVGV